jgi:lipopolysaccharide biosynthesis glycosyltransferase
VTAQPAPPLVLALATDAGFAMPTAVAVRSALDAIDPGRPVDVHVVGVGLDDDTWARLEASVQRPGSRFHPVVGDAARFAHFPEDPVITRTAYWRILLPELLPDVDRILYLDGDVMVRRDPGALVDADLGDASTAGVRDYEWWHASSAGGIPGRHDLAPATPYVNTGVLLMSLERWRRRGLAAKVQAFRQATPEARELDQDAINVAVHGDVALLDPRWNVQTPAFDARWPRIPGPGELPSPFPWTVVDQVRRDPWIVHFTTDRKPWRPGCTHPLQRQWLALLARTSWADDRPQVLAPAERLYRRSRTNLVSLLRRTRGRWEQGQHQGDGQGRDPEPSGRS